MAECQGPCYQESSQSLAKVDCNRTRGVEDAQWAYTIESRNLEDQSLWKMTKQVMRTPDLNPTLKVLGGLAYSDFEKAEALAGNLESQLQSVPVLPMQMDNLERVKETI